MPECRTIVLVAPSGLGKTFLAKSLIDMYPGLFEHAPVYVTREKRDHEERIAIGRVFLSLGEFKKSSDNSEFLLQEFFANYYYGYKKDSFVPKAKHLLVDVSPGLINSSISMYNKPIIVGLYPSEAIKTILLDRLVSRGDSPKIIKERKPYIARDLAEMSKLHNIQRIPTRVFTIYDDSTIPEQVIPWIKEQLKL